MELGGGTSLGGVEGRGKWDRYNMKLFCKNQNEIVLSFILFQTLVPKLIT